jgi:hypothetical protein
MSIRRPTNRALLSDAIGEWSLGPPPYLEGIDERIFKHMVAEWLGRMMRKQLVPSHRIVSYFLADQLNWATMDCWPSHSFIAQQSKQNDKTVQRAIAALEKALALSVFRSRRSRRALRYAPVYARGRSQDPSGIRTGRPCPSGSDIQDHESFLANPRKSSLPRHHVNLVHQAPALSFDRAERINIEFQLGEFFGGRDRVLLLGLIDDEVITRLCEASARHELNDRQIKTIRLAVNQFRRG